MYFRGKRTPAGEAERQLVKDLLTKTGDENLSGHERSKLRFLLGGAGVAD